MHDSQNVVDERSNDHSSVSSLSDDLEVNGLRRADFKDLAQVASTNLGYELDQYFQAYDSDDDSDKGINENALNIILMD